MTHGLEKHARCQRREVFNSFDFIPFFSPSSSSMNDNVTEWNRVATAPQFGTTINMVEYDVKVMLVVSRSITERVQDAMIDRCRARRNLR